MEEPSPAEMADYDHVHYDNVKGASFPSELCEEAKQLGIKHTKDMTVCTLCEHGAVKEQGLTRIGTRWVFTNKVTSFHPGHSGCSGDDENEEDGFDGHARDICCDPTC